MSGRMPRTDAASRPAVRRRGAVGHVLASLREPGMGAGILVAGISVAFATVLISVIGALGAFLVPEGAEQVPQVIETTLALVTTVFVGIAVYVAAIVTANTFGTIVAGRTRQIALLRLLGSSARTERARIGRQGLSVGIVGAVLGLCVGLAVSQTGILIVEHSQRVSFGSFSVLRQPMLLLPVVVVVLTTWLAAWTGARRVLTVTPLQALDAAGEASRDEVSDRHGRHVLALVLFLIGAVFIALGVLLGLISGAGVLVAFVGGILSFTGVILAAEVVMPPALRAVGSLFGRGVVARLVVENAGRHPERSSRTGIGVVIGVTLVTMFAVATASMKAVLVARNGGALPAADAALVDIVGQVLGGLVGVSAVIAGVGLVNLLTLGVMQRRRELGLLRALGLSTRQIRAMVLLEAAHVTVTSVACGLVLGVVYGWAGAQSLFGSIGSGGTARAGIVWPAVPWMLVLVIVAGTAVLTAAAAVTPTRLATRVSPVTALAEV